MTYRPEIVGYFYQLVEQHRIKLAIGCVINTKELVEVEKSVVFPPYVKNPNSATNPYYWGLRYIIASVARYQREIGIFEPIDFVFDEEQEKAKILPSWETIKNFAAPELKELMSGTPIYRDDKNTMPLQAADLLAWWILKWEREEVRDWAENLPFPWPQKRAIGRIFTYFGRKSFLADISDSLAQQARTAAELSYAKSLMPHDWA
jgi:hypothetical protein